MKKLIGYVVVAPFFIATLTGLGIAAILALVVTATTFPPAMAFKLLCEYFGIKQTLVKER